MKSLLNRPRVYNLFQNLLGAKKGRKLIASQYIRARNRDRILDIGCGTAQILDYLPDVEYFGFDMNPRYIELAEQHFGDRATFKCSKISETHLDKLKNFDIVMASGVLHHLDDGESVKLLKLAQSALIAGGRLVTVDPCFTNEQSIIAAFLIKRDRGLHVRTKNNYEVLVRSVFNNVSISVLHDVSWIPYTHVIMECFK